MKVDGLTHDERVFGSFGPGTPHDVLSDLLNGTPYNILMVGDLSNGAPGHLILTPASAGDVVPAPAPESGRTAEPADAEAGDQAPPPPPPQTAPRSQQPPPGFPQGVKTPQQLFEELQAMRQRQQQQQTQPQQPPPPPPQ